MAKDGAKLIARVGVVQHFRFWYTISVFTNNNRRI